MVVGPGALRAAQPARHAHRLHPPEQRTVACPNQEWSTGGLLGLDISPVVIQVPDFGDRFWVYQIVDTRTDSFATLGKMYGTTPGFYMLVGPNWQGQVPKGITQVFRASTNRPRRAARLHGRHGRRKAGDPARDRQVMMYPLSEYDGTMKSKDWSAMPKAPAPGGRRIETQWVFPDKFFDELADGARRCAALPGEEARYAQVLAVVEPAKSDPS